MRYFLWAASLLFFVCGEALAKDGKIAYSKEMNYKGQVENNVMMGRGELTYSMGGCSFVIKGQFNDKAVSNAAFEWTGLQENLRGKGTLQLTISEKGDKLSVLVEQGTVAKTKKDIYTNTLSFLNVDIPVAHQLIEVQPYNSVSNKFLFIAPTKHFKVSFQAVYHNQKGTVSGETTIPALNFNESSDYYISFLPDGARLAQVYRRGGDPVGLLYEEENGNYIMSGEQTKLNWKTKQGALIYSAPIPLDHNYNQGIYARIARPDHSLFVGNIQVGDIQPAVEDRGDEEAALRTFTAFRNALEGGQIKLLHGEDYLADGVVDVWDNGQYKPGFRDPVAQKEWMMKAYAADQQKWSGLPDGYGAEAAVCMTHAEHPEYTIERFADADNLTQGYVYAAIENGKPAWIRRDVYFNQLKVKRALYLHELSHGKHGMQQVAEAEKAKLMAQLKAEPVLKVNKQTARKLAALQQQLEVLRISYFKQEISLVDFNARLTDINTEINDIYYYVQTLKGLSKKAREFVAAVDKEYRNAFIFNRYAVKQIDAMRIGLFFNDTDFAIVRVFDSFEGGKAYSHYEPIEMADIK